MHHLNAELRGNWVETKKLVDFTLQNGWVSKEGERAYRITEGGRAELVLLHKGLESFPSFIARFRDR